MVELSEVSATRERPRSSVAERGSGVSTASSAASDCVMGSEV